MAMKLASLVAVLLLTGVAHADPAPTNPFSDAAPMDPYAAQPAGRMDPYAGGRLHPNAGRMQRGQLRQLLLQRFDRNRDGRLEPRERRQAARALQRLAHKLMRQDERGMRRNRFIRRYDMNRDGNVGPGEIPPAVADELRPLDRDGDGWLQGDELP